MPRTTDSRPAAMRATVLLTAYQGLDGVQYQDLDHLCRYCPTLRAEAHVDDLIAAGLLTRSIQDGSQYGVTPAARRLIDILIDADLITLPTYPDDDQAAA